MTGTYHVTRVGNEDVRAFIPSALPPGNPPLVVEGKLADLHAAAAASISRLNVAGRMVPSAQWFIYGFVRKEAVISSQIEGTQATLEDVVAFEVARQATNPADVQEVCNYVDALEYARREISKPKGLPLCTRLLCNAHGRMMKGVRGADQHPGTIRTSQNWVGGTRPGNARFVPPPPLEVPQALAALEKWIHATDSLPPIVRAGLAHVQFETIHPFLDGNGRIGRLLITLLIEHWGFLSSPLLYLSLAFKRHRQEYYDRLSAVRTDGDWEGWTGFFLECIRESADDAVDAAQRLFTLIDKDRRTLAAYQAATVPSIRLFDALADHPMISLAMAVDLLQTTKPTAIKAIEILTKVGVLEEVTGKKRDRMFAYRQYLDILAQDTSLYADSATEATGSDRETKFQKALAKVTRRYGRALRKLAE